MTTSKVNKARLRQVCLFILLFLTFNSYVKIYAQVGSTEIISFSIPEQTGESVITPNTFDIVVSDVDVSSFLNLLTFAAATDADKKVQLNSSVNQQEVPNIEIRFGQGSQKAYRFTVPADAGSGVQVADYTYQDYIDVPFQVWDVDNNTQLMVSFRDQQNDGGFTLIERYLTAGDAANHSREYIFIHSVEYSSTADSNIAANGSHMYNNLYFLWPALATGGTYDPNNLPSSTLAIEVATSRISAEVNFGSDLTSLVPTIEIDANSTVSPASGLTNDFTAPKIYTVTAQDGVTFEKYLVTVTEAEDPGIEADSLVLIDLYNSTDGANWVDPWNLEQPKTTWTGVSFENGRVTRLDLAVRNLSGTIPATLGNLSELTWLDLGVNNLTGQIPNELGKLSNTLVSLLLSQNNLSGNLPAEVGALTELVNLWIDNNQLEGEIPTELGNLSKLLSLRAENNNFSGLIPVSLGNTNIIHLYLQNNNLSGSIPPQLGNNSNLQILNLEANNLSGRTPDEISNITSLTHLFLNNNVNLTGSIPLSYISLNLETFSFQGTNLCELNDASFQSWVSGITTYQSTEITCDVTATDFINFSLVEQAGAADINTIDHSIGIEVPYGTELSDLIATFVLSSGAMAEVEGTEQISGSSANDFTNPVTYSVTAEDGINTQDWVISVTFAPNTQTDIVSFILPEQASEAIIDDVNHTISMAVVYGTDLSALIPEIGLSYGATISPPGSTEKDFSAPVTYTVTAEDGSTTQDWLVTITTAPNTETDIISYSFAEQTDDAIIDTGNHSVDITVVYNSDLTSLVPTIELSAGASVSPESNTPQDFTSPKNYTVTAEDGISTQVWVVTVSKAANTEAEILDFTLPEQTGIATIDPVNQTVSIEVESGTVLSSLTPTITLSEGATISPASLEPQDFSNPVTYTVTAEDLLNTKSWVVSVQEEPILGLEEELISTIIYPNPASREVTIDLTGFSREPIYISVMDISGNETDRKSVEGQSEIVLDVLGFKTGVYIIQIVQNNVIKNIRLIKE